MGRLPVLRRGGGRARSAQGARLRVVVATLRVGLAPAILAVVAIAAHVLSGRRRVTRGLCVVVAVLVLALLLIDPAPILAGGNLDLTFGEAVPGVGLGLRLDSAAMVMASMATVAALAALLDGSRDGASDAALMVCLLGAVLAALASNAVTLFAGAEIGNIGALLMMTAGRRRVGRSAVFLFAIQHGAALGLLAAAVELQLTRGTSDFAALAASPLPTAVALLWALGGTARVLSVGAGAGRSGTGGRAVWAGVASAPIGAMVLIRLAQASGGAVATPVATTLVVAGAGAAIAGVLISIRHRQATVVAGRALCLTGAGFLVAAAGIAGESGRSALAAVALFLEFTLVSAPAWCGSARELAGRRRRWVAALALGCAGALPIGYGTSGVLMELSAAASNGAGAVITVSVLGVTALITAAVAAQAAREVLSAPPVTASGGGSAVPRSALVALGATLAAAIVPGIALKAVVLPLSGTEVPAAVDAASVSGPGGGLNGGYLSVAVVLVVAVVLSVRVLAGARTLTWGAPTPLPAVRSAMPRLWFARRVQRSLRWMHAAVVSLDHRLVTQPQLLVAVAALAAIVFVFR